MDVEFKYICGVCRKSDFASHKAFFAHLSNYPDSRDNKFLCLQRGCLKVFRNITDFRIHTNKHIRTGQQITPMEVNGEGLEVHDHVQENIFHEDDAESDDSEDENDMENEVLDEECLDDDEGIVNVDINDVSGLDDYIFKVAVSLYGAPNLTIKHAGEIMKMLKDFHQMTTEIIKERVEACHSIDEAKEILAEEHTDVFDDYLTEHKFKGKLIERELYREPLRFTVGNEAMEDQPGEFRCNRHQGIILDIEFQIRKFLESSNVLETILNYQDELSRLPPGTYANFVNGSYWKSVVEKYPGKCLIPVFFYNDDFNVDNPKGPHSSHHALSPFYYLFPTLPPHLYSKLDYIFTALIAKASDMKMFGNDSPLYALVNAFGILETQGILLFANTDKEIRIHIVGCKILGDNLGLHASCGFRLAFNIMKPCITCEIDIDDLKVTVVENEHLKRTVDKYENYFANGTFLEFGVEKICVLNQLPSFHVSLNGILDYMHDVSLGMSKFSMQYALNYFIASETCPLFNLYTINERLKSFNYGSKERGNKPPAIKEAHLNPSSTLQMNANESSFFLKYFPLLQFDLIPHNDPVYQYVLDTIDMVEFLNRSKFSEEDTQNLDLMITQNRTTYHFTLGQDLKPKDHNLLHYGSAIRANGPARYFSTIRPEAKHRMIKMYTNNSNNRINIAYSASKKLSYSFALFLFNLPENINAKVTDVNIKKTGYIPNDVKTFLIQHDLLVENFVMVKNVKFKGSLYKPNDFLFQNVNYAIKIKSIYASTIHDEVLLSYEVYNIEFQENLRAYKVQNQQGAGKDFVTQFISFPSHGHLVFGNTYLVKTLIL